MADTIHLKGTYERVEALCASTIKPGHLIETYDASGEVKLRAHSTAKGFGEKLFAVEDALQGKTIDDSYTSGDWLSANVENPGSELQAWLKVGTNYVIGDKLISAGDGTLEKITGSSDLQVFAVLLENVDLSASAAVATMAKVRAL